MTEEEAKTILNAFSGISSKRQKHPQLVKAIRVCLNKLEQQEYIDDWIKDKNIEINKLNKELEEWRTAYQEEKDKQFDILNENIKLKDVIDRMAEDMVEYEQDLKYEFPFKNKEEVKEYFMKEDK